VFASSKSNIPQYRNAITATLLCIVLAGLFNSVIFDDLIGDFLLIFLALCLAAGQESKSIKPKNTYDQ
jgi:hypothetical protein